ncbi:DUF6545 domain-containing protein [Oerskovia turbata]
MSIVAVAAFATAALWTGLRARTSADAPLPLGLGLVALASAMRIPQVADLLRDVAPAPTHEVAKHIALVGGCVFVAAWVMTTLTGRTAPLRRLAAIVIAVAAVMTIVVHASGPWTAYDLDSQSAGRPWMWVYWTLYYGAFVASTSTFAYSALATRTRRPLALRWGMDLSAAGAIIAVAWAVISGIAMLMHEPGSVEPYLVLGIRTRYLILASSVLVTTGIVGHLVCASALARERRRDLARLHEVVTAAVDDVVLPHATAGVAAYHRTIEILDAMAALSRHSRAEDVERVLAVAPGSTREVVLAYQLQIAAARRARGDAPSAEPDDWSELLADEDALRRLGRALRDHTSHLEARHVLALA